MHCVLFAHLFFSIFYVQRMSEWVCFGCYLLRCFNYYCLLFLIAAVCAAIGYLMRYTQYIIIFVLVYTTLEHFSYVCAHLSSKNKTSTASVSYTCACTTLCIYVYMYNIYLTLCLYTHNEWDRFWWVKYLLSIWTIHALHACYLPIFIPNNNIFQSKFVQAHACLAKLNELLKSLTEWELGINSNITLHSHSYSSKYIIIYLTHSELYTTFTYSQLLLLLLLGVIMMIILFYVCFVELKSKKLT